MIGWLRDRLAAAATPNRRDLCDRILALPELPDAERMRTGPRTAAPRAWRQHWERPKRRA